VIRFLTEERWFHMPKEGKIHIKLEICKDKHSNTLTIMTHFDEDAPNIFKDTEGYYWIPTVEEKDFLNDAFNLMPARGSPPMPKKPAPPTQEKKESKPQEPEIEKEFEPVPNPSEPTPEKEEDEKQSPFPSLENKDKEEHVDMPPFEQSNKEEVFEVEGRSEKEPKDEKEIPEKDKGLIAKADDSAIENALKKYQNTAEDKSIVEADEQTIIEKVLSQKKKGKWVSKSKD